MNKQEKIELAKARLKKTAGLTFNEFGIIETKELDAIKDEVKELNKTIEAGVKVTNIKEADTSAQIEAFGQKIAQSIDKIRDGITVDNLDKIVLPEPIKEVAVSNLKDMPKFESYKKDFAALNKAIKALNKAVAEPKGQTPADYIPVRIVISPNQTLEFLKTFPIPSFGGGGGSSTSSSYHGDTSIYRNLDTGVTGQVIKAGSAKLCGYFVSNLNDSSKRYIKFYNKATAPTNSDTPVITIPLQPKVSANVSFSDNIVLDTGLSVRATGALADNDNTAPTANDVVVNVFYK